MASGVEMRVPFVDSELERVVAGVPDGLRFASNKRFLRESLATVFPERLVNRPKQPFLLPLELWFAGEVTAETQGWQSGSIAPWYCRWSLFILQQWLRRNGFTASADEMITERSGSR
jgi:asparagine synthetase B (glutamine-hydrolysing)